MAHTYEELKGKTIDDLREIAKGLDQEAVKGYTQMNKEHLLPTLCKALGVDIHRHPHHAAVGIVKAKMKARMHLLKAEKQKALEAGDAAKLKGAVDGFFDAVLVMAEDPAVRANRLALLGAVVLLREEREMYPKARYYKGYIPFKVKSKKRLETGEIHYEINPAQSRAFEELLDALKRDEIKVIFVQVPGYTPSRKDEQISKNVLLLKEIAKERRIPFLDYETEWLTSINMNTDLFADWTHLNEAGSEAFSTLLREDLVNLLKGI